MADTLTARRAPAPTAPAVGSTFTFDAIGTRWCIDTEEPLGGEVRDRILDRIRRFDRTYSRFRPDSLVAQVATAPAGGRFEFPEDSVALFDLYDDLVTATDGAVDPLVGRQLELLGYDPTYSLTPAPDAVRARERARARPTWTADIVRDGTTLITWRPLVIDVGAAGKGYLVDIISTILQQAGVAEFVVDAGGDLRHRGEHGIRVGLEHSLDPRLVIGVANLQNRALCASAVNRRAWGNGLHHVLDARTGAPATEVVATWVVAGDAALADGLATALFFTGAHQLAETHRFAYVRMLADGRAERSPDFDGELFTRAPTTSRRLPPRKAADRSRTMTRKDMTIPRSKTLLTTIIALSIAAATAGCATTDTDGTSPSSASNSSVAAPSSPSSRRSKYADGTYNATGQYGSLPSSIGVAVTLVGDVITAVMVTPHATDPTSLDYQTRFAQAVPALVVGRNIDEVNLSKVAVPAALPTGSTPRSNRSRPKPPTDVHPRDQPHIRDRRSLVRATVMYGAGDVRVEQRPDATVRQPTDAVVRVVRSAICGSDLWAYGSMPPSQPGRPMGHEFLGMVEDLGADVTGLKRGDLVVTPFVWADNTCDFCTEGLHTSCRHGGRYGLNGVDGGQGEAVRVPQAQGTLVKLPVGQDSALLASLLTLSDVFCVGHHACRTARVGPRTTVTVIGDGAVGLSAVLAAKRLGAEPIILMGRHKARTDLGQEFGATDVVPERGAEGIERVRELTGGDGTHAVLECVGSKPALDMALGVIRDGGAISRVGLPQYTEGPLGPDQVLRNITITGGAAPARAYIEELLPDVLEGRIEPGRVFDRTVGLDQVADGYRAMADRTALKVLIQP